MKRSKRGRLVESRAESTSSSSSSSSSRIASASASPHANWSLICSLAPLTHRRKVKLNRRGNSAANFRGAQIYAPILKSRRDLQRPALCSSEGGKKSKGSSFSTFLYGRARAQRLKRNRSELQSSNEDRNSVEIRTASSKIRWCDRLLPYILIFYVWLCAASRATWLFAFPSILSPLSPPLSLSHTHFFFYRYRIIFVTHEQSIFALRAISGLLTRYIEKRSGCNSMSIYLFASARFY